MSSCCVQQVSIEPAQSNLDTSVLEKLRGKTVILGAIDLSTNEVKTPEIVARRTKGALPHVDTDKVIVAGDCGMKYLPRDVAFGKMRAMAEGAALARKR